MKSRMQVVDNRFGLSEQLVVRFATYRNGQRAILLETLDGAPWTDATRAVGQSIPADCVAIKDYSENQGVLAVLIAGNVIEALPVAAIGSGYVTLPVHRLTPAALAHAEAA